MASSDDRPAPSPLATRASQRPSTFSSTNSAAGSFVGSVKQTAKDAMDADVPLGAWAAAARSTAKAPTIGDIRNGSFSGNGWTSEAQKDANEEGRMRRASSGSSGKIPRLRSAAGAGVPQVDSVQEHHEVGTKHAGAEPFPVMTDGQARTTWTSNNKNGVLPEEEEVLDIKDPLSRTDTSKSEQALPTTTRDQRAYSTGWRPPPKLPWTKSWAIGLTAFGKWAITPLASSSPSTVSTSWLGEVCSSCFSVAPRQRCAGHQSAMVNMFATATTSTVQGASGSRSTPKFSTDCSASLASAYFPGELVTCTSSSAGDSATKERRPPEEALRPQETRRLLQRLGPPPRLRHSRHPQLSRIQCPNRP